VYKTAARTTDHYYYNNC